VGSVTAPTSKSVTARLRMKYVKGVRRLLNGAGLLTMVRHTRMLQGTVTRDKTPDTAAVKKGRDVGAGTVTHWSFPSSSNMLLSSTYNFFVNYERFLKWYERFSLNVR